MKFTAPSRLTTTTSFLLALLASESALAHAPPFATGIDWLPGGDRAVVRTNRGLIFEEGAGDTFSILCGESYQSTVSETVPFTVSGDGTVVVGSYAGGLRHSTTDWCSFEPAKDVSGVYTSDLQKNPSDPDELFALALPLDGSSPRLYNRPSASESWQALATLEGAPNSLRVAPTEPDRLYVVSMRSEGERQIADVLRSSDHGRTFMASSLTLEEQEIRAYVLEAGPRDAQRLFLRTETADGLVPERLLLSVDGGVTFREPLSARGPLTLVSSPDGEMVWVGAFDGLFQSTDGGQTFAPVENAPQRVGCLALHDDALYACGYADGEFGVLASPEVGAGPFAWFLRFGDVRARLSCAADSDEGASCEYPFEDWAAEQLETDGAQEPEGVAGMPTAPNPGNPAESPASVSRESTGCSVPGPTQDPSRAGWGFAALAALIRLARRRPPTLTRRDH
jgi:MYXO-CTERM domain-containing protein